MSATLRQNHCSALFNIVHCCSNLNADIPRRRFTAAKVLLFFELNKKKAILVDFFSVKCIV